MNLAIVSEIRVDTNSELTSDLLCPSCRGGFLHHGKVTMFNRGEDAASVFKVTVDGAGISAEAGASGAGNPSSRRHGMTIAFECELCEATDIELCLAQHKGQTEIFWRFREV